MSVRNSSYSLFKSEIPFTCFATNVCPSQFAAIAAACALYHLSLLKAKNKCCSCWIYTSMNLPRKNKSKAQKKYDYIYPHFIIFDVVSYCFFVFLSILSFVFLLFVHLSIQLYPQQLYPIHLPRCND